MKRYCGLHARKMTTKRTYKRHTVCMDSTASPKCLFSPEPNLRHGQSGFESQKIFQPNLYPRIDAYCLLSNGPHFVHLEVFNRDGKLVSLAKSQL